MAVFRQGEFFGALFWGSVADKYGRRRSFLAVAAAVAGFGIASAGAQNLWQLCILRGGVGFAVGGTIVIPAVNGVFLFK